MILKLTSEMMMTLILKSKVLVESKIMLSIRVKKGTKLLVFTREANYETNF